jgi:hypothetical protein
MQQHPGKIFFNMNTGFVLNHLLSNLVSLKKREGTGLRKKKLSTYRYISTPLYSILPHAFNSNSSPHPTHTPPPQPPLSALEKKSR